MYAKWMDGMKDGVKPWADLMTLGTHAAEAMVKHRMEAMTALFEAGLSHARTLGNGKDATSVAEAQGGYLMQVSRSLLEVAQKDLETLAETQHALVRTMDSAVKKGAAKEGVTKARRGAAGE